MSCKKDRKTSPQVIYWHYAVHTSSIHADSPSCIHVYIRAYIQTDRHTHIHASINLFLLLGWFWNDSGMISEMFL